MHGQQKFARVENRVKPIDLTRSLFRHWLNLVNVYLFNRIRIL